MAKNNLYSVSIYSKQDLCITVKELNRIGLKHRFSDFNLCAYDVIKLQLKAKKHLKNSFLSFNVQATRAEYVQNLKKIYPNYSFRQLREIGFNI